MIPSKKILVIQNCQAEGFGAYLEFLLEKGIDHDVFHAYADPAVFPQKDYRAVLVGGTPISVREIESHDFLKRERDYLAAALGKGRPLLGICFGGQIIARILGAEVRKNPMMEIGGYDVELTAQGKADSLFEGFRETFPVFHWHGDAFGVPSGATLLAKGKDCPNQAFRFENSLALQFHLEVRPEDAARWAEAYEDELLRVNKTAEQVITECRERERTTRRLARRLMKNFLMESKIDHHAPRRTTDG
jgi:GMP synthase-like glutamine amidotransferase